MRFYKFPHFRQLDAMDCGPTCLKIIAKYFGRNIPIQSLREFCETNRFGTSIKGITIGAEKIGLRTLPIEAPIDELKNDVPKPCLILWKKRHFVILYKIRGDSFYISDPAFGLLKYNRNEFIKGFANEERNNNGIIMLFDPTPTFFEKEYEKNNFSFRTLFNTYVLKHKPFITQLIIGLLVTSLLNLIFPFLTQAIVDIGIQNQDINFIYLILFSQLMLFLGRTGIDIAKGWLLLHLTKRININILTDFLRKLMRLPISFFDNKQIGDLFQRISDHERIEAFITNSSINTIFSLINFLIFSIVLIIYNINVMMLFVLFSIIYTLWILVFLKKRRILDYKLFQDHSDNQGKLIELISGVHEIKLNNAETSKRWEWEKIQARIFQTNLKSLTIEQTQSVGAQFINELKNIIISFYTARLVIEGELSLGMMLSISYMIGQLNQPILQLIDLFRTGQNAKISFERLSEIHTLSDEETGEITSANNFNIQIKNVNFRYDKLSDRFLFKDLSLHIESNKVTAIVGYSGSGKTTLLKLLLKFYKTESGSICIDGIDINKFSTNFWRDQCGVVMQEGTIFPDTVANNITLGETHIDHQRLIETLDLVNLKEYVNGLPFGYKTEIGRHGINMSTGQKQRILIARAIYKNPPLLLLDEATSSLDAINENTIMKNLYSAMRGKTVIIIAHRLSTVKLADKLIVLHDGKIVEEGNHNELINRKGAYYNLIKNQLELGK